MNSNIWTPLLDHFPQLAEETLINIPAVVIGEKVCEVEGCSSFDIEAFPTWLSHMLGTKGKPMWVSAVRGVPRVLG
jgi:hypothetical protein